MVGKKSGENLRVIKLRRFSGKRQSITRKIGFRADCNIRKVFSRKGKH